MADVRQGDVGANEAVRAGMVVSGPLLPEAVEILVVKEVGGALQLIGRGVKTNQVHSRVLRPDQIAQLTISPARQPFDGDAGLFRLGIEAHRLGLAYEYDPFFSLSIARIDPLPHQLEAVYDYFLKLPRIRFLLADDPGAGKTIMAGLLIKELKARGLARRILIVTPANLSFQWQRELKDKFRENFNVIRGDVLRATYGQNPWQEQDQVITSISWVSRIEDANESLLRTRWDLIIVDEAHRMSARDDSHTTLAFDLGEQLSQMTDHYLLMTATPHKGDPENFRLFLSLLDKDVYADVKSLEEAMRRNSAPFYLRRTKEALVSFPDPETGDVHKLFTKREVRTPGFDLDAEEMDFYEALTRYVEDQSSDAASDDSARARAVGFTMAMLQRRMASSIYAVRRSLERMKAQRERILADPDRYRREQVAKKLPDNLDDLPDDERQEAIHRAEEAVISVDPATLRKEIARLTALIDQARILEARESETKLTELKQVLTQRDIFDDPATKLLIFTEHKDTLDYLVGDGKEGRPLGKLREWGLSVTQIHGGMKIGSRDEPGTRIYAEQEFRTGAQILVATEAAGEGINLQFCHFMINYDIPWNPIRLEQRMGRIHRYGQERDCLIINFVAINTREGSVLAKLLERLREIRKELGNDSVFDVVGEIFPGKLLESLFRDLYAGRTNQQAIEDRIVKDVNLERFRDITESALEGLAKKELNLAAIMGKSVEARERRLVPEVVEHFFLDAAPHVDLVPRPLGKDSHIYRVGKLPRMLIAPGDGSESRFGRLAREYDRITFDKAILQGDPTLEWVTPGHPLFEVVREHLANRAGPHLQRGAVFYQLDRDEPARLDIYDASIKDGRGRTLHRRLFAVEISASGALQIRQPTLLMELVPAPKAIPVPEATALPVPPGIEAYLYEEALDQFLQQTAEERAREVATVRKHVEISLNAIIDRQVVQHADLFSRHIEGATVPGLDGQIAQADMRLDELNNRLDARRRELDMEGHCTVADIALLGRAWVLPHPDRAKPGMAPMRNDPEIERIAVEVATRHERDRGWDVESVEKDNRGFDLISRRPHSEDPKTYIEVRFIEVKGRAGVGEVALSENEYRTAQRLKGDYWLYAVFDCSSEPHLHTVQDPARLGWQPVVQVAHYRVTPEQITQANL